MSTETKGTKLNAGMMGALIGSLTVYMIAPTANIPNVITAEIGALFPMMDPGTLSYWLTITNLVGMLGAFLFGTLAGKKLKFKTVTLIALACFIIGGGAPFFFPDEFPFALLLGSRAILGLGLGCFTPLAQTVIITTFSDDETKRSYWLGIGGICFNIALTFGSTLAGMLALISWQTVFAFYFLGLIPLIIFLIFFKEPAKIAEANVKSTENKISWREVPARAWVFMACFMLSMLVLGFFTSFGRTIVGEVGVDPAIWGTFMSVRTVGSILVAALFGFIFKFAKQYCLTLGAVSIGIGFALFYFFSLGTEAILPVYYVGSFLIGFGMNMLTVGMAMVLSLYVSPAVVAFITGMNALAMNLGTFASSPVSQIFFAVFGANTPVVHIFLFGIILIAIVAVVYFIAASGKKIKQEEVAA